MKKSQMKRKRSQSAMYTQYLKPSLAFKSTSAPPMCYYSNFFGGAEFTFMSLRTPNPRLRRLYAQLRGVDWESLTPITVGTDERHRSFATGYHYFHECRQLLLGKNKKNKRDPYYKKGALGPRVASGLIAKLISSCFRPSMKKRLVVVNEMADLLLGPLVHDGESRISQHDFSMSNVAPSSWKIMEEDKKMMTVSFMKNGLAVLLVGKPNISSDGFLILDDTKEEKEAWMMTALRLKYDTPFFQRTLLEGKDGIYEAPDRFGNAPLWSGPYDATDDTRGLLAKCLQRVKRRLQSLYPTPPTANVPHK